MYNFNRIQQAFTIGLLAYDDKFSYCKGCKPFTGISSYQLKRFLDKEWDESQLLEEYIKSPSAAGAVVLGRASNGRKDWKLQNGKTLDEFESESV